MSTEEKTGMSSDDKWGLAVLIVIVIGFIIAISSSIIGTPSDGRKQMLPVIAEIQLDKQEEAAYKEAIVKYVQGDEKPIKAWITHLRTEGKKGILPALPNGYDQDGLRIVDDTAVLMPSAR